VTANIFHSDTAVTGNARVLIRKNLQIRRAAVNEIVRNIVIIYEMNFVVRFFVVINFKT
jgi:hypothetical protein